VTKKQVTSVALAAWTGGAFEMQNEFNGLGAGSDHGTMGGPERSWKFTWKITIYNINIGKPSIIPGKSH